MMEVVASTRIPSHVIDRLRVELRSCEDRIYAARFCYPGDRAVATWSIIRIRGIHREIWEMQMEIYNARTREIARRYSGADPY